MHQTRSAITGVSKNKNAS
uniref:Uncharacterized protein n=1 Tax=Arundo donax TaxID=35708 RepID=A0A0A9AEG0_ARUDO